MLSEPILAQILGRLGHAAAVRFDEVTGSTNATCAELAANGAPEWTLVAAGHQTAGRGRVDRSWKDRPGKALLFSVLLRPRIAPEVAGLLPLLAGAAMAEAVRERAGVRAGCKWPNDVMVGSRKAGGILAEASVQGDELRHVVLGVGMNLGAVPPDVGRAASVPGVDPGALLEEFLVRLHRTYRPHDDEVDDEVDDGVDDGFAASVLTAWRRVSVTLGRRVRATGAGGRDVVGVAVDVDERGGLVVEGADGGRSIVAFGEVDHLRSED
jgi:BirA family transcriptional regulator, biotin operon repressor / biotin---[acetyl-CoA-carboxylase] ligase